MCRVVGAWASTNFCTALQVTLLPEATGGDKLKAKKRTKKETKVMCAMVQPSPYLAFVW